MKKAILAAVVSLCFAGVASAEKWTGVVIDTKCGNGKNQEAAAKHPKACAIKCAKDGDLNLVVGDKMHKLDAASKAKALEYLAKEESTTTATVEGKLNDDGTLSITSIAKADAK